MDGQVVLRERDALVPTTLTYSSIAPVAPVKPVIRQHRIGEEDTEALKIPVKSCLKQ
jgi:hypothetical protein